MSIEKDVEKKYIDELERKNKKLKKKKQKRLLLLLLLLLLLGGAGLLMGMLGLLPGFGDSKDSGKDSSAASSSSASSSVSETTTTAVQTVYDDIKVSGSTYIYQSQVKTLAELKSIISIMKENVVIRITDDNATKNAMDDLINMLHEAKRGFTRLENASSSAGSPTDQNSSSEAESSSQTETTTTKE